MSAAVIDSVSAQSMLTRALGLTFAVLLSACSAPPSEAIGTRSDAIISGTKSGADQDSVVLLYQSARNQTCTGTMIAPNLVVTARHCVSTPDSKGIVTDHPASSLRVFTGREALAGLRDDEEHPDAVGKTLVAPDTRTLYPDIAFVVLDRSLETPSAAIRLARGVGVGETLGVIGYGLDETGTRPRLRMQRGGLVVSQIGPGKSSIGEPLARGELVFGEAACSGDSGGPAFSESSGALIAIASRVGNGTPPSSDDPAAFCIGDTTNDVYTDFTPVADLAMRAFGAAGASPVLEDPSAPPSTGKLTSAQVSGGDDLPSAEAKDDGGCAAAPAHTRTPDKSLPILVAMILALVDRRRTTRAR